MYVRSKRYPLGKTFRPGTLRALFVLLYVLYPAGCILQIVPAPDNLERPLAVVGLLLVAASLLIFALLAGTSLQRQSQEQPSRLDERELAERNRATYVAYVILAGSVMLGLVYMMIAKDLEAGRGIHLWLPKTSDHWNGLFWGFVLVSLTLPGAVMAWRSRAPEGETNE
ncbi:MAG: hypothetical protein GC155_07355 [Alphaproteobacteria bacterium]|nr:hypothetical protein [Alphaproteobacteria bacterium]